MNRYSRNGVPSYPTSHSNIFPSVWAEKFSENIFETRIREAFTLSIFHVLARIYREYTEKAVVHRWKSKLDAGVREKNKITTGGKIHLFPRRNHLSRQILLSSPEIPFHPFQFTVAQNRDRTNHPMLSFPPLSFFPTDEITGEIKKLG